MRTIANSAIMVTALCASLAMAAGASSAQSKQKNLAANGGFEHASTGWAFTAVAAASTGQVVTDQSHEGKACFKLTNKSAFAPNVFGRVYQIVPKLEPFTTYRISCWAKGQDAGIVWIGGGPGWYLRQRFPEGTFDWTPVSVEYTTDGNPPAFELMVATESPTAAVWVDDVRMVAVRADTAKRDQVLKQIKEHIAKQKDQLARVQAAIEADSAAKNDSVVQLGLSVAERFLRRAQEGGPHGTQAMAWTRLQLEEVGEVLKQTELRMKSSSQNPEIRPAGSRSHTDLQPWPTSDRVAVRDGLFYTQVTGGVERPFWFYGFGHFAQVFADLPNFRSLGASIVQDGRTGPSSMNADGSLSAGALTTLEDLKRADRYGMRVDWLLSPHYFPEWAYAQAPGVRGGGPGFLTVNIDHPVARKVYTQFVDKMTRAMKQGPLPFSICLSNEPVYDKSGRDPQSRPAFARYLRKMHGRIQSLNALYGTNYKRFEDVPPPAVGLKSTDNENRAYYDWVQFNNKHFADWHAWLRSLVKKNLPNVPTHAKIMVFFTLDRDKLHFGVDPELFCNATDLAGCDAYAFPDHEKTYSWHGHEFFYDLLYSFRHQPVFDSENHIIPDGSTPWHIPMTMTRAQFWQGGLHHQGVTTTWVWEEPSDASLVGSIYMRPANVYGAGRAMLDLNRFGTEVAAINQASPQVALLYSPTSIFWENAYKGTIFSLYTQLNFLGQPVTFVSERQLAAGTAAKVQWIVLPQATHVAESTVKALGKFIASGGHVLMVGENNLAYDEYHRPRKLADVFAKSAKLVPQKDELKTWQMLRDVLSQGGLQLCEILDTDSGQPVWGVEFRSVPVNGATLMPIINLDRQSRAVKLPVKAGETTLDLLTGEQVEPHRLLLEPMVPRLLKIGQ